MNRDWIRVFIAAFFEIFWVIGLAHAYDFWTWTGTIIAIIISNYLMITAGQVLPAGTVYAVFVGLGTAGTVISEILFFGEPFRWEKVLLILLLLIGVTGLKLVTDNKIVKEGAES
ncbi:MAG: DMT family transporter [Peptococcales bacterium]|jgi:paired small multidrug resistance pump